MDAAETAYYHHMLGRLEPTYLAGGDPRAQSGFSGDEDYWERARRVCVAAVERPGTYLDVGAASGHLMECVERWTAEGGVPVEAHGLELSARLTTLARERLPAMAGRIHEGNVMTWTPPRRYTYARSNLEFVPPGRRRDQVARLLDDVVEPGGRVIICSYGSSRDPENRPEPVAGLLAGWRFTVAGAARGTAANGVVVTEVAWVDAT